MAGEEVGALTLTLTLGLGLGLAPDWPFDSTRLDPTRLDSTRPGLWTQLARLDPSLLDKVALAPRLPPAPAPVQGPPGFQLPRKVRARGRGPRGGSVWA